MESIGKIMYEIKIKHTWVLYFTVGIPMIFGLKGFIPDLCFSYKLVGNSK